MIRIRIHGRGGQGAVTFAHMLCLSATEEGKFGQSSQGQSWDRRGTPMEGYARIGNRPISERGFIVEPDYVVVLDSTIVGAVNLEAGMKDDGKVIVNSPVDLKFKHQSFCIDATSISLDKLKAPITNTAMLGAFAGATGLVCLDSVERGVRQILGKKFSEEVITNNIEAVRAAFNEVK
ncbi:MAG: pyruvate ferredoxin oxidoreductase gamma subunit [bacterium]|nr:MAG: pyruvate ferredoxin oxidoreductase gamma subunit [bacterium]